MDKKSRRDDRKGHDLSFTKMTGKRRKKPNDTAVDPDDWESLGKEV